MNEKLKAIAEKASSDLVALVRESEQKILEAWNACEEEAQDNETKPKFKLGLTVTLDLDADSMETALTYGIRHKLAVSANIPNPNQTEFPMEKDVQMSITTGGKTVHTTAAKFREVAEKLRKN